MLHTPSKMEHIGVHIKSHFLSDVLKLLLPHKARYLYDVLFESGIKLSAMHKDLVNRAS